MGRNGFPSPQPKKICSDQNWWTTSVRAMTNWARNWKLLLCMYVRENKMKSWLYVIKVWGCHTKDQKERRERGIKFVDIALLGKLRKISAKWTHTSTSGWSSVRRTRAPLIYRYRSWYSPPFILSIPYQSYVMQKNATVEKKKSRFMWHDYWQALGSYDSFEARSLKLHSSSWTSLCQYYCPRCRPNWRGSCCTRY